MNSLLKVKEGPDNTRKYYVYVNYRFFLNLLWPSQILSGWKYNQCHQVVLDQPVVNSPLMCVCG